MTLAKRAGARRFWVQVHLWLGLTLGVVGALLGLSGSILVYDHELDAWLNPQRYAISGTDVAMPYSEYARWALQAQGGRAHATGIRLPDQEALPVIVSARAGTGPFARVYLDPPTGRVLDVASGRDWLPWLHSFHESLTLREYNGREIVGAVGIAMLISSLTGVYLWWPRGRLRAAAFGFRRGFGVYRNLHYTLGIWGVLVLALLSFTGVFLAYPDPGRTLVRAFGEVAPSPRGLQGGQGGGPAIGVDEAAVIGIERYPNAKVLGLGLPAGPRGVYRVNLRESGDTAARATTMVFVDPRSGVVVQSTDLASRTRGDAFLLWQRILHEGGAFGGAGRFLIFLGGLLPTLFVVTGLVMWLRAGSRPVRQGATAQRTPARAADASQVPLTFLSFPRAAVRELPRSAKRTDSKAAQK